MDLLVDLGNSRLKWAQSSAGELGESGSLAYRGVREAFANWLKTVHFAPDEIRVANVAGEANGQRLTEALQAKWGLAPRFAVAQTRAGELRNGYRDHRRLGVDRWLAMLAAVETVQGPLCVVDAGTAVTIDLIDADRRHLGGYIVPGLDLMQMALGQETGDLRRFSAGERPEAGLDPGLGTAEAIACGALASVCALLGRSVTALADRAMVPSVVVTGGDAGRLLPHLDAQAYHRPLLVLEGLARYVFDPQPTE